MNYEHKKIQKTLRQLMKKNKSTYESIARDLKISTATVKRRLNGDDMTIQQLKDFAEALSVSFYELIELSKKNYRDPHLFTDEQESLLASDFQVMKIFRLILAGCKFYQIIALLNCSERDLRKVLRDFEKVRIAELRPNDRIVTLVHFPFRWQKNGKLERAYRSLILKNLMQRITVDKGSAGLNKQFEFALSEDVYQSFCREIESIYSKYRNLSEVHLGAKIDLNHTVAGTLFVDRFSLWG